MLKLLIREASTSQNDGPSRHPNCTLKGTIAEEFVASGTIDGHASVSRLLIDGLTGFALVMLCVRLAELSSKNRTGNPERHLA